MFVPDRQTCVEIFGCFLLVKKLERQSLKNMSNTGRFRDTAPNLPAAGKTMAVRADTAAACFTTVERPPTPEEIRRFRKTYTGQPGKRIQHWGSENDPPPRSADFTFGIAGEKGYGVGDLQGSHVEPSTVQAYQNMRAEATYDSTKKEPLGRGFSRNYSFPEEIKNNPDFRFGLSGSGDTEPAIAVIFPPDAPSLNIDSQHLAQYKKSHGAFEPGEQKKRDYTWEKVKGGIDPNTFVFGGTAEIDYRNGVAKALNPDLEYDSKVKPTEFMPKTVADFRQVRADELGKVRNLGLGNHKLGTAHTYGMPSKRFNDWGAKECITGNYTEEEQQPDGDLGKSLRRGCAPEAVIRSDRTFGVPCVRSDIKPPKLASVADSKNYGNEPGARALLYPQPFAQRGVYEEDFLEGHPKAELKDIVVSSGVCDESDFEQLHSLALSLYSAPSDAPLSVEAIRRAMYAATLNHS